ncbi:MAG: hypothetical protein IPP27_07880 [Bacteroidetes bacterium]|nr:hypothetical protein [Bacteroidota bacterium]
MIKKLLPFVLFFGIISTILFSCKKDDFETSGNVQLSFSEDTVMFDTVFTSVGSATEVFTVYNTEDKAFLKPMEMFRILIWLRGDRMLTSIDQIQMIQIFLFSQYLVMKSGTMINHM